MMELGWALAPIERALPFLRELSVKSEKYKTKGLSEWDTAAVFVEPILRGLGWDTLDIEQVQRESRRQDQIGDIHVLVDGKIVALLEVKPLWPNHRFDLSRNRLRNIFRNEDEHHVAQLWAEGNRFLCQDSEEHVTKRCVRNGRVFLLGVLTNGIHWLIYDLVSAYRQLRESLEKTPLPIGEADLTSAGANCLKNIRTLSRIALVE